MKSFMIYTGTGTIAQLFRKVIGVESVPDAIKDASKRVRTR
jgi:tRNA/tmRNA/rRNA uracil-C5-methylase (TrmA/RlmC/RlmD family)